MAVRRPSTAFPWSLALGLTAFGVALLAGGLSVLRSSVVPASNGEGQVAGMAASIVLQALAALVALGGFLLVAWMVVQMAGRLAPERGTDAAIDARLSAALAKDASLGPSDHLTPPSGLPWERA